MLWDRAAISLALMLEPGADREEFILAQMVDPDEFVAALVERTDHFIELAWIAAAMTRCQVFDQPNTGR